MHYTTFDSLMINNVLYDFFLYDVLLLQNFKLGMFYILILSTLYGCGQMTITLICAV